MGKFKLVAADGAERDVAGYKHGPPKANAKSFQKAKANVARLPAKVDLRSHLTEVEDQGDTNSCTANATAGAYEYLIKRHLGDDAYAVSRMFMYYNARWEEGASIEDEGAMLSDVIEGLKTYGACSEETWRFDKKIVNNEPVADAYEEAKQFLIEETEMVPTDLASWKTALASGHPIIFGLKLSGSFDKHRKPGLVPVPAPGDAERESHGGHAMLCVGYSDPDKVFIVRNSWGPEWGDRGYCYIPYSYLMDEELNYGDSWIMKRIEVLPADESSWSDDDESILEDPSTAIANMTDEEYQEMLEGMGEHPFERRLALLFLCAVGADGEVSEDEVEKVSEFLEPVLEVTGGQCKAKSLLKFARKHLENEELMEESIDLIGEYFAAEVLASIVTQMQEAAGMDDMADEESEWIDALVERWQVELDEEEEEEE